METQTNVTNGNEVKTTKPAKKAKKAAKKVVAKKVVKKASKKKVAQANGNIKARVMKYLKLGKGPTEAARLAGCSLTTARYHAKRLTGGRVEAVESTEAPEANRIYELEQKLANAEYENSKLKRLNRELTEENTEVKVKAKAYKELISDKL